MGAFINKELWEAGQKLIADHERKLAERLQNLPEKYKPYESLDAILKEKFHLTQEQIDNYPFRSYREEIDAEIERFLNEDI